MWTNDTREWNFACILSFQVIIVIIIIIIIYSRLHKSRSPGHSSDQILYGGACHFVDLAACCVELWGGAVPRFWGNLGAPAYA